MSEKKGDKEQRALADELLEKALLAYHAGRYYETESLLYKVIWTMNVPCEDRILARTVLGNSLSRMGRTEEAERELKKAMELSGAQDLASTNGDVMLSLGKIQLRKGNLNLAVDLFNRAHESYQNIGNHGGITRTLIDLGGTQVLNGDYERAESTFKEAVSAAKSSSETVEQVRALHNLAYVSFHLKDYFRTKETLCKCLELCQELDDVRLCIHSYSNLAHTNIVTGDLDKAEEYLERAGELLDRSEDHMSRLNVRWVQGLLMAAQGDLDGALSVFDEIEAALQDTGAVVPLIEFLLDYIPVLVKAGKRDLAENKFDIAKALSSKRFKEHFESRIYDVEKALGIQKG